jgi:tetratricopeptide (TPR) repeat protein
LGQEKEAALEFLEALRLADMLTLPEDRLDGPKHYYNQLAILLQQQADAATYSRLSQNVLEFLIRPDWRAYLAQSRHSIPASDLGEQPVTFGEILVVARSCRMIEALGAMRQLMEAGQLRSAMEEALNALMYAPAYLPVHITIADLFLRQGRLPEAIEKYKIVAQTHSTRGQMQPAIELLRRVVQLAPLEVGARRQLIELLVAAGHGDEAVQAWNDLAGVYYDLADLDLALEAFQEALELSNQFNLAIQLRVKLLHQMADLEVQCLDWRRSIQIYEQVRLLQPDDLRARTNLVSMNLRLGQDSQAMGELKNYISYLSGQDRIAEAIPFVEGLLSEYPDHLGLRRNLAGLYRQTGRITQAIEQLDRVGQAQLKGGDRHGAAQTVEAILALNPAKKEAYLALLKRLRASR